jgi:hypothetical protein
VEATYKNEVYLLVNGCIPPLPVVMPSFPALAQQHDLTIVTSREKSGKIELEVTAKTCVINWGDGSFDDEYENIKEKHISHRYHNAGNFTITVNADNFTNFSCGGIDATAIYLNNCPALQSLNCYLNKLTSLDISRCPALTSLHCGRNKLTSLSLDNNMALTSLSCANNLLTFLNISNHTELWSLTCDNNQLSILNMGNNSVLRQLHCNGNQLSKHELHRIFNNLPVHQSSYRSVYTTLYGNKNIPDVFCACGANLGYNNCNKNIATKKNWLIWTEATLFLATLGGGTPTHWEEKLG